MEWNLKKVQFNFMIMKKSLFYLWALVFCMGSMISSCSKTDDMDNYSEDQNSADLSVETLDVKYPLRKSEKLNIFKGPEVQLGEGKARSFVSVDEEGFPIEIGLVMRKEVLDNLSILPPSSVATVLPFHHKATELTPFEHIGINWQPTGHGPVFYVPHFDIHFYMISNEERLAIPEYSETTDPLFNLYPPEGYMPADYINFPGEGGVYPEMGKHWVPADFLSYVPLTHIVVLGTYNGEFVFQEPMVSVDYLLSNPDFSGDYSQPLYFQESTNYPTKYNVYVDPKTQDIYITLSDFVARQAGE